MLEEVFWKYFKNTGNINAYMATKELDTNEEHEYNTYQTNTESYHDHNDDYFTNDMN
ncbi:YqzL family protein [Vallitalea okinawensis]|uniref:YqzL family protein n=1 Tax=Vallitalea okinawensis TaxID=2078660 RepID=UPI000CFCF777|nr:YqzL family protein [Vallitalea okinawensis]